MRQNQFSRLNLRRGRAALVSVTLLALMTLTLAETPKARRLFAIRSQKYSSAATAMQPGQRSSKERGGGLIKGRVVTEGNQPLPNVTIVISALGGRPDERHMVITDDNGRFEVDGLAYNPYSVFAFAPGYVFSPIYRAELGERQFYRVGEFINITMMKGGVITGQVTNSMGEPLIASHVRALRVRDVEGRPVRNITPSRERFTDDRGIYRLYGLEPGMYIVMALGANSLNPGSSSYAEYAPTYYPSATRDTATEVSVRSGEEAAGIDIRFRGDRGHAISGFISVPANTDAARPGVSVRLAHAATGIIEAITYVNEGTPSRSFDFFGVPDGEYYLIAHRPPGQAEGTGARNLPRRVVVKGADVTGVELPLAPLGSIEGNVVSQRLRDPDRNSACGDKRDASMREVLIKAVMDEKADSEEKPGQLPPLASVNNFDAPGEKGDFLINDLAPGLYHIEPKLPGENWYVQSITLPAMRQGGQPQNLGRNGLALKSGDRVSGLTITLAEGAASLRGVVVPADEKSRLPSRLRLHLVPAQPEFADDTIRFLEAPAGSNGTFTLTNIVPGNYFLLARPVPDDEPSDQIPRPGAWGAQTRASIRAEAEAGGTVVELQPCRKIVGYTLKYSPGAKKALRPALEHSN